MWRLRNKSWEWDPWERLRRNKAKCGGGRGVNCCLRAIEKSADTLDTFESLLGMVQSGRERMTINLYLYSRGLWQKNWVDCHLDPLLDLVLLLPHQAHLHPQSLPVQALMTLLPAQHCLHRLIRGRGSHMVSTLARTVGTANWTRPHQPDTIASLHVEGLFLGVTFLQVAHRDSKHGLGRNWN